MYDAPAGRDEAARRQHRGALLAEAREEYVRDARSGRGGRLTQARFAGHLDELIRLLVEDAAPETPSPLVVCALGGYGRRTLCLHSDIDLLIVFERPITASDERFVNRLLQPLWDLRLTIGQHVRELADFDTVDEQNPEFLLALCDLRLLAGDVRLFDELLRRAHRGDAARAPRLIDALLLLVDERYAEFNNTLYQLEPDVKKAPGGLRDAGAIRLLRFLAREAFAARARGDADRVDEAEEFLLRVRSLLHADAGRDMNVLTHDHQERVAAILGFGGSETAQQVEGLMSEYFRHARTIARAL